MKSYGQLWEKVVSEDNLFAAWHRVRKGHGRSEGVLAFERGLQDNLGDLRDDLVAETYEPGDYRQFPVKDPKPRTISCAPVRDRVVHHALCGVLAPLLESGFIENSYACRKFKGMHLAVTKARAKSRQFGYFCKMDVRHYFDSVDHEILERLLGEKFREQKLMRVLRRVIRHPVPGQVTGKGIPIGNLTSQWFANFYLNEFDHLADAGFGRGGRTAYLRYMDDMLFFAETKADAWRVCDETRDWLCKERKLQLKDEVTVVAPVTEGVPFLGFRVFPDCWRFKRERFLRTRRTAAARQRQFWDGEISEERYAASLQSADASGRWFGFKGILNNLATGEGAASGSNRVKRGGSWNNTVGNCRSAYRNNNTPSNANANNGFRLSSTLLQAESNPVRPALRVSGDEHACRAGASRPTAQSDGGGFNLQTRKRG